VEQIGLGLSLEENGPATGKLRWPNMVRAQETFGTPFISRKRLKIETSYLTCRLTTKGTMEQIKKLGPTNSCRGSGDPFLEFLGPLYI